MNASAPATDPRAVVVIEAPGKRQRLLQTLVEVDRDVIVWATGGQLCRHRASLWPLGIALFNGVLAEPGRAPNRARLRELRTLAAGRCVVLATDADAEGAAIARDVAFACADVAARFERMQITSLDADAVRRAWGERAAWHPPRTTLRADARRVLDRLVASHYTRPGRPAGRVLSAYLSTASRETTVIGHATFTVPAAHGRPFVAHVPITAATLDLWRSRIAEWEAYGVVDGMASSKRQASTAARWGYPAWILQGFLARPALDAACVDTKAST